MTSVPSPFAVAERVMRALEALGVPSTIGGSIASSLAGEPRSTIDIDIVAALDEGHVDALTHALEPDFYVDPVAVRRAIRARSSVNLIDHATQLKVDIFVAGGTPLDHQQLARRLRVDVGGHVLYVHPPEDILLQKLRWFRKGGEVSDRQWRDVLAIARTQGPRLDRAYLTANADALGVADLVVRVLGDI